LNLDHLYFDIVSDLGLRNSDFASPGISTLVVSALQIGPFLKNKANFQNTQMNVNSCFTRNYEQRTMNYEIKNKANSKPIKANSNPISASKMPKQTQNKAKTNPIYSELAEPISFGLFTHGKDKIQILEF